MIDLRSDTVTKPTDQMRQAMATADVGDDVWGEDPTVLRLQTYVAELLGKDAALFVPSGTMANQLALMTHTQRGDEVLLGWGSHCTNYEGGATAGISHVHTREIGQQGFFTAADVVAELLPPNDHIAPTRLIWVENTHNRGGGRIWDQQQVIRLGELSKRHNLALHIDGARLFNAAIAQDCSVASLVAPADSASICLSKGLGAPVGSVLCGSRSFIDRARRYRKMLGGGMRQVGILAAAGLYALAHHIQRLVEDHENARAFAARLVDVPGLLVSPELVETNIVFIDLKDELKREPAALLQACSAAGVKLAQFGPRRLRAVTHLDVTHADCIGAAQLIRDVVLSPT